MDAVVGVVGIATDFVPVPGLKSAFSIIKYIWDNVQKASSNRKSLRNLAVFCTEIFMVVNRVLRDNDVKDHIQEVLNKFQEVLMDIQDFTKNNATVNLFRMLVRNVDVGERVVFFQNRLQNLSTAFNIAAYSDIKAQLGKMVENKHISPSDAHDEGVSNESQSGQVPLNIAESHAPNSSEDATCTAPAVLNVQKRDIMARTAYPFCDIPSTVPLLRAFHGGAGDHFYTTDAAEIQTFVTYRGYVDEGTVGYLFPNQQAGTIPLFRLYNSMTIDHFYTTDMKERDIAAHGGYVNEGIVGFVYPTASCGAQPLFRMYAGWTGDHFYTMSVPEKDNAVGVIGYMLEHPAGCLFPAFPPLSALPPTTLHDCGGPHEVVYVGSAIFESSVHPCKIVPHLNHGVRVAYGGTEHRHLGRFELLPINDQTMEWVLTSHGRIPPGRSPVEGGYEEDGRKLFHAIVYKDDVWIPGKTGEHLGAAYVAYGGLWVETENYKILCWRS